MAYSGQRVLVIGGGKKVCGQILVDLVRDLSKKTVNGAFKFLLAELVRPFLVFALLACYIMSHCHWLFVVLQRYRLPVNLMVRWGQGLLKLLLGMNIFVDLSSGKRRAKFLSKLLKRLLLSSCQRRFLSSFWSRSKRIVTTFLRRWLFLLVLDLAAAIVRLGVIK